MESDNLKILAYIKENGITQDKKKRQNLNEKLSVEDFRQNYFDKKELVEFCRDKGIPSDGLKSDLNERIELFLKTGLISKSKIIRITSEPDSKYGLYLDKPVINYKSDPVTRDFFKKHIPEFKGFSAYVQKDLKKRLSDGERLTYQDLINIHKEFIKMKNEKDPKISAKTAHDSCQFNQFQIDYKRDSESVKLHSIKDAWYLVRDSPGEKTYKRYKASIEEIRNKINKK